MHCRSDTSSVSLQCGSALSAGLQGRQSMVGGVGTATEVEEDCNPAEARKWLKDPDALLNLRGSNILEKLRT